MDDSEWAGQLRYQLQKLSTENSHLREINARYEQQLRKAEEQLNAAGSAAKSHDEIIKNLQSKLHQVSSQNSLLEEQRNALMQQMQSEKIRNHVQQTSGVIPWEKVVVNKNDILGQGSCGIVYKGTFGSDEVAVKELLQQTAESRILFEREIRIMAQCRHPNLVLIMGVTNHRENPLLVTELLHCDLRTLIEQQKGLKFEYVTSLSLDVAKGLGYLHAHNPPIIHRDVKTDNILVEKRGNTGKAKLSDFGTANFYTPSMTPNRGTVMYAAPEVLTYNFQSPQMDVYSFGWVVQEMCTGNRPGPRDMIQQQIELVFNTNLKQLVSVTIRNNPLERPTMDKVIEVLKGLSSTST
ncbi:hypothetical protein OS493_034188 [Desmophyllum pertusum]|uniref:Protein kinase domain-containing protein n=1 Tax=Desmophyllum pertusum TaxID=174260 RepID=A0A9W9ZIY1_9CNID|nr:hypothetical protein OS493_034188 [Desmophyllum pertusum]